MCSVAAERSQNKLRQQLEAKEAAFKHSRDQLEAMQIELVRTRAQQAESSSLANSEFQAERAKFEVLRASSNPDPFTLLKGSQAFEKRGRESTCPVCFGSFTCPQTIQADSMFDEDRNAMRRLTVLWACWTNGMGSGAVSDVAVVRQRGEAGSRFHVVGSQ